MVIKRILKISTFLFGVLFIVSSCTKEVDFSQAETIEANPVTQVSFLFFEVPASNFVTAGNQPNSISDFVDIDALDNTFVDESLTKAELVFETQNTVNKSYQVQIDLLNNAGVIVHTFDFLTPASTNNLPITTSHVEVFDSNNNLAALKQTKSIAFTLSLLPGQALQPNAAGVLQLKSKGVFYFNIKNQE